MGTQHIICLQAENVKRLTAVKIELTPDNRMVILSGENGQGKSSVLDAIEMALCGKSSIPGKPIRDGKDSARIILKTEEITVIRTFTVEGGSYLSVKNNDGFKASSPQDLLNGMYTRIGFDPLAFASMKSDDRTNLLLKIFPTKIDLVQNANYKKGTFESRTEANREVKRLSAVLSAAPKPSDDTPTEEVSVAGLAAEMSKLNDGRNQLERKANDLKLKRQTIKNLQEKIAEAEKIIERDKDACKIMEREIAALESEEAHDYSAEINVVQQKIKDAERVNIDVRTAKSRKKIEDELAKQNAAVEDLEKKLAKLDNERAEALKEAKFPVEGLSINDAGLVTLNGIPFEQASSAEKIMVGVAIGAAANPQLRVCMNRDGSLLDSKTMEKVSDLATKLDLQIWLERVEDKSPTAVQIVEGSNIGATDANVDEKPAGTLESGTELFGEGAGSEKKTRKKKAEANVDPFRA